MIKITRICNPCHLGLALILRHLFIMKSNMGFTDRAIRVIFSIIMITFYFAGVIEGTLGVILLVLSIILLATAFINYCPLYAPFGISTKRPK